MSWLRLRTRNLFLLNAAALAVIVVLEMSNGRPHDATLLVTVTFFSMLVQGCVALAAVGGFMNAVWLKPIRGELASVYPLLLVMPVLFLVFGNHFDVYSWTGHPTVWLNETFFMARNIVLMLIAFLLARALEREMRIGGKRIAAYSGWYLFVFIVSQSLIAFDWMMSLEYPWINTLMGGFFFVEALVMGLAVTTFIIFAMMRAGVPGLTEPLRDTAKMMLGFCFMWGGFLYAQFLVIWYGNVPEEVAYLAKRAIVQPYSAWSWVVLTAVFIVPFVVLLSRIVKTKPVPMMMIAGLVLCGFFIQKLLLVLPVAEVSVNPLLLAVECLLLAFLVVATLASSGPGPGAEPAGAAAGGGAPADADLPSR